jgi:hypothetical protein
MMKLLCLRSSFRFLAWQAHIFLKFSAILKEKKISAEAA